MIRSIRPTLFFLMLAALGTAPLLAQNPPSRDWSREAARPSPPWIRDAVIYEVFPRAFSAKGDLNGVTSRLDDLKALGVKILWIMPIHPFGLEKKKGTVGSPYAVRDFYEIHPDHGTKDDFRRLVSEAHRRGLKIIIDIVANHTSWDSVMMKNLEFYVRDKSGKILSPKPDWLDIAELNYDNPTLRKYMIDMLKYWLKEFDLDGFRCDVAMEVPTDFWENARAELEAIKPDIFLLAEATKPDLMVKAFNADYAWPFHERLTAVMVDGWPATAIRDVWKRERAEFPRGSLHMRFSDNHDEKRAIARFGERGAMAASALVFTMDGIPLIYNGMEVGDTAESGDPALFERLPILWQIAQRRPEFPRFYRQMIALRNAHPALRQGETQWLPNSDDERIVTFLRRSEGEEFLIAVNLSNRPFKGRVEHCGGTFKDLTPTLGTTPTDKRLPPAPPTLTLEAWGFSILRRAVE